jgi:metal-dependent amidase/aminoacylase/carboxypeptidase family protein
VVSFGKISGEGRTNIVPDKVTIEGTVRTYDESWRKSIHEKIIHMASSVAAAMGGSCDVRIAHGYPFLDNDGQLTSGIRELSKDYLGEKNVIELDARMTSEDFSYFANEVPSCLYRLGIRNEQRGIVSNLHTATFDVDEHCLQTGMGLMAWIAISRLNQK